jgi:alpha-D-ribose 1-methylphosphonate 5-triphosphate synthase subunit PhnH
MSETSDVAKWLKFHTGAPVIADSSISSFALIGEARALPALDRFAFGTNEYPDRSTTLILEVASLTDGPAFELSGPGIDGTTVL